jgi:hypothetical protein
VTPRSLLMEAGTYAVDPHESYDFPDVRGTYLLAPGDVYGTRFVIENCGDGCIGFAPERGGNLACATCGSMVGSRMDACGAWQFTRLLPSAVHRIRVGDAAADPAFDATLAQFAWQNTYRDTFGEGPGVSGEDPRTDALWREAVIECLVRATGRVIRAAPDDGETNDLDLIVFVGAQSAALSVLAGVLLDRKRVRHVDDVDRLEPGMSEAADAAITLVSLERSARPVVAQARRLPSAAAVNVRPDDVPLSSQDSAKIEPRVREVLLDGVIWRFLVRAAGVDRTMTGIRWRKAGLAAETYRDDPGFSAPARVDLEALAREFGYDRQRINWRTWA